MPPQKPRKLDTMTHEHASALLGQLDLWNDSAFDPFVAAPGARQSAGPLGLSLDASSDPAISLTALGLASSSLDRGVL